MAEEKSMFCTCNFGNSKATCNYCRGYNAALEKLEYNALKNAWFDEENTQVFHIRTDTLISIINQLKKEPKE